MTLGECRQFPNLLYCIRNLPNEGTLLVEAPGAHLHFDLRVEAKHAQKFSGSQSLIGCRTAEILADHELGAGGTNLIMSEMLHLVDVERAEGELSSGCDNDFVVVLHMRNPNSVGPTHPAIAAVDHSRTHTLTSGHAELQTCPNAADPILEK